MSVCSSLKKYCLSQYQNVERYSIIPLFIKYYQVLFVSTIIPSAVLIILYENILFSHKPTNKTEKSIKMYLFSLVIFIDIKRGENNCNYNFIVRTHFSKANM